jgi:hypothetical protein
MHTSFPLVKSLNGNLPLLASHAVRDSIEALRLESRSIQGQSADPANSRSRNESHSSDLAVCRWSDMVEADISCVCFGAVVLFLGTRGADVRVGDF